jgi:phosphoadenosine phosphosulfate reductase
MISNIHPTIDAASLAARFETEEPQEILRWALDEFGRDVALACSFGAEDMVLVDLLARTGRNARIFVLDTGRLHEETYAVMEAARRRYGIEFEVYFPETRAVQDLLRSKGPASFYESIENRKQCCMIRKVEPLRRALTGQKAWITGLRRAQAVTRLDLPKVEIDESHDGILKLNPLADWSEEQVWSYIRTNGVPYNELHDKGFPSIGCSPCTRAVQAGEDVRAGRWWWENPEHKECGLHLKQAA